MSPSSNTPFLVPSRLARGMAGLQASGFRPRLGRNAVTAEEPSKATIKGRVADLHEGFSDPSVRAIVSTIGGWASHQVLEALDVALIRKNPTWFIGYSDSTSIHLLLNKFAGVASVYGPALLPQFGEYNGPNPYSVHSLMEATSGKGFTPRWPGFRIDEWLRWDVDDDRARRITRSDDVAVLREGACEGSVMAANFETLMSHAGTQYWPDLRNKVLFVELSDSARQWEALRLVHQLAQQPGFNELAGLVLGVVPAGTGIAADVVHERLAQLTSSHSFPVVIGLPFGHVDPIMSIPVGAKARLSAKGQKVVSLSFGAYT
nr:LD-carboxypeptidase [Arthrobacter sp. AG258]